MSNAFETLKERGFIYQTTDDEGLKKSLAEEKILFYAGFDPSASSLHIGNLVPVMAAMHMQRAGHRPIILVGGGTGLIGDPSGKTEMRKMLTKEDIASNAQAIKNQLSAYIDFGEGKAELVNNADWLTEINYIDFLRDFGALFSINKMLTAESVKQRLEKGLSFLEFNYSLLQAFDFFKLAETRNCLVQLGGQDQWGNIVAGIDLIRRKLSKQAYGITFPLITNDAGEKFGKSVDGAIWLDKDRLAPYEFYQFWRNVSDNDTEKLLALFTFLPMDEVRKLGSLKPPLLNRAKEILAFEATRIIHGRDAAAKAFSASVGKFGAADPDSKVKTSSDIPSGETESDIPSVTLDLDDLRKGYWVVKLFNDAGLASSNSEARRLIGQGGCYLHGVRIESIDLTVDESSLQDNALVLRAGKKKYKKVVFS